MSIAVMVFGARTFVHHLRLYAKSNRKATGMIIKKSIDVWNLVSTIFIRVKYLFRIFILSSYITDWRLALTLTPALLTCICLMDTENKFLIQNNKIYKRNGGINVATVKKFSICYSSFLPQQFIQHFHSTFWWPN